MKTFSLVIGFLVCVMSLSGCGKKICVMGIGDCKITEGNEPPVTGGEVSITLPSGKMYTGTPYTIKIEGCDPAPCKLSVGNISPAGIAYGGFTQVTATQFRFDAPAEYVQFTLEARDSRFEKNGDEKGRQTQDFQIWKK